LKLRDLHGFEDEAALIAQRDERYSPKEGIDRAPIALRQTLVSFDIMTKCLWTCTQDWAVLRKEGVMPSRM
jgi:hypothetical protein